MNQFYTRNIALLVGTVAAICFAGSASALTITDDMNSAPSTTPGTTNNYPWTSVIFGGTAMSANAGITTLSTTYNEGIWFGNGSYIGNYPGWNLGTASSGNYLSLTTKLVQNSAYWSFYYVDLDGYYAGINFNPTTSTDSYNAPTQYGYEFVWGNASHQGQSTFVAMDLSDRFHTFEALLKNGLIDYAVDGQVVFSGFAAYSGATNLLVIGDGSGSTPTGTGSMLIDRVVFDTAPTMNNLASVPVPAAAWLLGSGLLGLAGVARRKAV